MLIANVKLKYLQHWIDHLGRNRYRIRRKGQARIELPVNGDPHSPEFLTAYYAAMRGQPIEAAVAEVTRRGGTGSVHDAIARYIASDEFKQYSPGTQAMRRPILNRLDTAVGNLPLAKMDEEYIRGWISATAPTQGAKKTLLLGLKPFLAWALTEKLIDADPSERIKIKVKESEGWHTWTDDEIEQYRNHHPVGTMARVAIELILNVAGRRGDAIKLGRQHLKNGWLEFTQEKNKQRKPVTLQIKVEDELAAALAACPAPATQLTFLANERGRPFPKSAFAHWFRRQCDDAGLPQRCVTHGLRKSACRIMAEADCTVHQIKSKSGHRTLKEVQRYTDAVDHRRSAEQVHAKLAARKNNVVPLAGAR